MVRIAVIGAGALGGQFAAHLAHSGADLHIIDTDRAHVAQINAAGLQVGGAFGDKVVRVSASIELPTALAGQFDAVFVHVDSNNTAAAAATALAALSPTGFCWHCQNGLGNASVLQQVLGAERVLTGSTMVRPPKSSSIP